jgi:hypothetical protein
MTTPSSTEKPPPVKPRPTVDMSSKAIDQRLREVGELWDFWRYLRNFKPVEVKPKHESA